MVLSHRSWKLFNCRFSSSFSRVFSANADSYTTSALTPSEIREPTFSATMSFKSFSRFKNSSRSSLGMEGVSLPEPRTDGDALREGVDADVKVGESILDGGRFCVPCTAGPRKPARTRSSVAHSASSTVPPDRQTFVSPTRASFHVSTHASSPLTRPRAILSSADDNSVLTRALFLMLLARIPKRRVESVSDSLYEAGEQLMISVVRELPPRDSWRIRVSLESR